MDYDQQFPLHVLCTTDNISFDMLKALVHHNPDALTSPDKNQELPLHIIYANDNISFDMLKAL
eukprot:2322992-Ditylum_brightwellii.AAC.1